MKVTVVPDKFIALRKAVMASLKTLIPEYCNPAEVEQVQAPAQVEDSAAIDPSEQHELAHGEGDELYQFCPSCISARVHRSHARNFVERMRRTMGPERLFRCDACGWRGWLMPLVTIESGLAEQAPAPNLADVDEAVSRSLPAVRPTFLPRNLP